MSDIVQTSESGLRALLCSSYSYCIEVIEIGRLKSGDCTVHITRTQPHHGPTYIHVTCASLSFEYTPGLVLAVQQFDTSDAHAQVAVGTLAMYMLRGQLQRPKN